MQTVETAAYIAFARRVIAGAGRRVATGDLDALADLKALHDDVDQALSAAVAGLRDENNAYSWQAIANELGITRQAAMQRWPNAGGARRRGGQPTALR